MCSVVTSSRGGAAVRLAALIDQSARVHEELAVLLADADAVAEVAGVPGDALAAHVTALLASLDRGSAVATTLAGRVDATQGRATGSLIAGRFASSRRWLEVDGRVSAGSAGAVLARARDLREDYPTVAEAWLSGEVSSDAVREMTVGIRKALRAVPVADRGVLRDKAVAVVLPVAKVGTVADVRHAIDALRFTLDADGTTQAALDAHLEQSVTCERVGAMSKLTAWLTHEGAAAVMTVLGAKVDRMHRDGTLAAEDALPDGVDPESWEGRRLGRVRRGHLLAVALTETMTGLLDDNQVGSHHGIAPHVTVTVDLHRQEAGLGGELCIPGSDEPVLIPSESVRRILCDADITTVVTRHVRTGLDPASDRSIAEQLQNAAREVLWVGRTERVVPPRLRRALEARDRHCAFPGCRAHVGRCHAHHVHEWEHGGPTDISNTVLLCVRHHHAVHEGHWSITRTPGTPPGATSVWTFTPPPRPPRP